MTFYCIHAPRIDEERVRPLKSAASKLKIHFRAVDPFSFDFSKPSPIRRGDIIYRASRGRVLFALEDFLVRPDAATFYANGMPTRRDPFALTKAGITSPQTIFCSVNDRKKLASYVEKLGGFPIILKALGGTRGLGVMKIETFSALIGMVDYLLSGGKLIMLSEYIPVRTSARFIVLGESVIAALEYRAQDEDFRTNAASSPTVLRRDYSRELQELAVRATQALGWEFGGVDILINKKKNYVTEVNFPCNFVRAQNLLKQDIAFQMVEYLKNKGSG